MSRHLVNQLINMLNNQQQIAAHYFGLYADPSDIGKNADGRAAAQAMA